MLATYMVAILRMRVEIEMMTFAVEPRTPYGDERYRFCAYKLSANESCSIMTNGAGAN